MYQLGVGIARDYPGSHEVEIPDDAGACDLKVKTEAGFDSYRDPYILRPTSAYDGGPFIWWSTIKWNTIILGIFTYSTTMEVFVPSPRAFHSPASGHESNPRDVLAPVPTCYCTSALRCSTARPWKDNSVLGQTCIMPIPCLIALSIPVRSQEFERDAEKRVD